MKERPEKWEVVCKTCMAGFIMPDEEVGRRLDHDSASNKEDWIWPCHCGIYMQIRKVGSGEVKPTNPCTEARCRFANYGNCSCSCGGRYHGVNNPYPQFNKVKVAPLQWYNKPIRIYLPTPTESSK